jgi:hypothetical protein
VAQVQIEEDPKLDCSLVQATAARGVQQEGTWEPLSSVANCGRQNVAR